MDGKIKILIIIAVILMVIGAIIFICAMAAADWNFEKLGTSNHETHTHTVSESFSDISITTSTADITFLPSEDGECRIVCYENKKMMHTVEARDGKLVIRVNDERAWYEKIFSFGQDKITVHLPLSTYSALSLKTKTGEINVNDEYIFGDVDVSVSTGKLTLSKLICSSLTSSGSTGEVFVSDTTVLGGASVERSTGNITFIGVKAASAELEVDTGKVEMENTAVSGKISIEVSTGRVTLSSVSCFAFESEGDTGDILLRDVRVNGTLTVERDTGDVRLERCDADEIFIKTDTGDVSGTLLTDKVFVVRTDTGHVDVPKTVIGGRCEIETDTGNIKIRIN